MTDYASEFESSVSKTDYASDFENAAKGGASNSAKNAPEISSSVPESTMGKFTAGVGQGTMSVVRGAKQLIDTPALWLEKTFGEENSKKVNDFFGMPTAKESAKETQDIVDEAKTRDQPLLDTTAGSLGSITGKTATTLLGLKGAGAAGVPGTAALANPTTYKAAAASGAFQGALEPTSTGETRAANVGIGALSGMGGNAVINGIGRIAKPIQAKLSSSLQNASKILEDNGINLDAAQKTGSTFLNKLRSGFSDNPFTASEAAAGRQAQEAQFNRAVLRKVGVDANAATPDVMRHASDKIGEVFEDVLDRNVVAIDAASRKRMSDIEKEAGIELGKSENPISQQLSRINEAMNEKGVIEGPTAYAIKKSLDRISNTADSTLNYHARKLNSALKDSLEDSLSDVDKEAFKQARIQYSNLKKIEDAVGKDGSGDISPSKLANVMMQKKNRQAGLYGRGNQELVELAHAGNMLLPDRNPNSGTTARLAMQLGLPLLAGTGTGVYSKYEGGDTDEAMTEAGKAVAATYAAPKLAAKAIANKSISRYLQQGTKPVWLRDLMTLPQRNETAGAVTKHLASEEVKTPISNLVGIKRK